MAPTAADVVNQFRQVDTKSIALQNKINSTLQGAWFIPPGIMNKIQEWWKKFTDALARLWANVKEIFENLGDPIELWQTGSDWSDKIGKTVSAKASFADAGGPIKLDDEGNWTGSAADKYFANLLAQRTALTNIKSTFSDGVQTPLTIMMVAIPAFWIAMITAVIVCVKVLAGASAATFTVIGIPPAILAAIGAIAALAAAIALGIIALRLAAMEATSKLKQALNFTGYHDKKWPEATAA